MDSAERRETRAPSSPSSSRRKKAAASYPAPPPEEVLLPVKIPATKAPPIVVDIYVVAVESTPKMSAFGLSSTGPFSEGGVVMVYEKPGQEALVRWHLGKEVKELWSPYVEFVASQQGIQSLTITSDGAEAKLIPFFVKFDDDEVHDPQIVVTPIGNVQSQRATGKASKSGVAAKAKRAKSQPAPAPAASKGKSKAASKGKAAGKGKTAAKRSKR